MIEFSIDMEYCLDRNKLDCVILHDENGEMDDMVFVPERTCGLRSRLTGMYCYECSKCGRGMKADWAYCPNCGAKVVE